jgi:hypothetical protein
MVSESWSMQTTQHAGFTVTAMAGYKRTSEDLEKQNVYVT